MAMLKQDLKKWINSIPDNSEIGIDDGGLTLQVVNHPEIYLEVGGIPEEETEVLLIKTSVTNSLSS